MAILLPDPSLKNLKLQVHESILVTPCQETEIRSFFLSCIDQVLLYPIPYVSFFKAHPDYPPKTVAKRLKTALAKLLVHYDFMAGRFHLNVESGRLAIHCNALGVGFVEATSEFSLLELGDLVRPNSGFHQLVPERVDTLGPEDDQPLFLCQVTSFRCGGFAIGMSTIHSLLDAQGLLVFLKNLASVLDNKPISIMPCHNRHLLDARSPPQISFPHTEFLQPDPSRLALIPKFEELDHRVFRFTPSIIHHLKEHVENPSSFMVAASLIWRCKALSSSPDKETVSTLLTTVEFRSRISPPLPPSYSGNAILVSSTSAKRGEIESLDFSDLVELVSKGTARMNDEEYIRSCIDWFEVNKVPPHGDYFISGLTKIGLDQLVYPWGKPVHHGPVVTPASYIACFFVPDEDGFINAIVSLPCDEMVRFESHFRNFLGLSSDRVLGRSRL